VCQAIPRRILQVDGARLEVEFDGARAWVEACALPDLAVGQYVIVHAGQARVGEQVSGCVLSVGMWWSGVPTPARPKGWAS